METTDKNFDNKFESILLGITGFFLLGAYVGIAEIFFRGNGFGLSESFYFDYMVNPTGQFFITYSLSLIYLLPVFVSVGFGGLLGGVLSMFFTNKRILKNRFVGVGIFASFLGLGVYFIFNKIFLPAGTMFGTSAGSEFLVGIGIAGIVASFFRNKITKFEIGILCGLIVSLLIPSVVFGSIFAVPVGILGYLAAGQRKLNFVKK